MGKLEIASIKNNFIRFHSFLNMMKFCMSFIIFKQYKIFNSIIIFNSIYMMDLLFRFKIATQVFFHYKTTSFYIAVKMCIRMIAIQYVNISIMLCNASLPSFTKFSRFFRKFFSFIARYRPFFKSTFWNNTSFNSFIPSWFSYLRNCFAFDRTKMSSFISRWINFNFFIANRTFFNHIFASKMTATFSLLKRERLSSQDLLVADFKYKKSAPSLANFIILQTGELSR